MGERGNRVVGEGVHAPGWGGLQWTAWMPLIAAHPLALGQIPEARGFLRVKAVGRTGLVYVGFVPDGLRFRVERLSRQVSLRLPPSADLAAVELWEARRRGWELQVSAARYLETDWPDRLTSLEADAGGE